MMPTRGFLEPPCERAVIGRQMAALPRRLMNARRRTPRPQTPEYEKSLAEDFALRDSRLCCAATSATRRSPEITSRRAGTKLGVHTPRAQLPAPLLHRCDGNVNFVRR